MSCWKVPGSWHQTPVPDGYDEQSLVKCPSVIDRYDKQSLIKCPSVISSIIEDFFVLCPYVCVHMLICVNINMCTTVDGQSSENSHDRPCLLLLAGG